MEDNKESKDWEHKNYPQLDFYCHDSEEVQNIIDFLKVMRDMYDVICGDWSWTYATIDLLKKHIPAHLVDNDVESDCSCPVCDYYCVEPFVWKSYKYCPNCGQAVFREEPTYLQEKDEEDF